METRRWPVPKYLWAPTKSGTESLRTIVSKKKTRGSALPFAACSAFIVHAARSAWIRHVVTASQARTDTLGLAFR
ncbi:hypothetical protein E5288_WYG009945 [Bos mutus]|uniref:Uncharacterized protein n=1 Tax=Bos mutus TaxID=72004 RepID=A0A6B0S312_9CETA|nr:hypothetical protein [Bos mutus]